MQKSVNRKTMSASIPIELDELLGRAAYDLRRTRSSIIEDALVAELKRLGFRLGNEKRSPRGK